MSSAHIAIGWKISIAWLLENFFKFSTKIELCRSNISTNWSKILKWNAGVMALRRKCHFLPEAISNPVPSHSDKKSYSALFSMNFWLLKITSTSFGSVKRTECCGPNIKLKILPCFLNFSSKLSNNSTGLTLSNSRAIQSNGRPFGPGNTYINLYISRCFS